MLLLNANTLKIIAAFTMLIDHIGYIFFPDIPILRIIGRLAFPIFAFTISRGCIYTKNKLLYFLRIFSLAIICQIPYLLIEKELYFGVLFTFSLSIIAVYSFLFFKNSDKLTNKILSAVLFAFIITAIYILNSFFEIDYGFWGCILPLFAVFFKEHFYNISLFSLGLIILSFCNRGVQPFCILALPLLFLYNGEKGKWNMKYFFYVFYPLHLAILYTINIIFFS